MSISVYPTPSGATTSFYGIVGTTNGSTSVTIPSGLYTFVADNASGALALGDVTLSTTSGVAYLTSQITSATVSGLNKGVTWTTVSLSSIGLSNIADGTSGLTFGGGRFIGSSSNGLVYSSLDGINWTRVHTISSGYGSDIAYGNGTYVVLNGGIGNNVQTSTDTVTWTSRVSGTPGATGTAITYGNGIFLVAPTSGDILGVSTDGITWTSRSSGALGNTTYRSVEYLNNLFFIGRDNGWISTSTDAITWTTRTSNMNSTVAGFAYGNNTYVSVGGSYQISSSTDGITWTSRANGGVGSTNAFRSVAFHGGIFIAVGNNNVIVTSTDGINWTSRVGPFGTSAVQTVAGGNNIYVVGPSTNTIGYAIGERKWFLTKADSTTVV